MSKIFAIGAACLIGFLAFVALFPNLGESQEKAALNPSPDSQRRVVAVGSAPTKTNYKDFDFWRLECAQELKNCRVFQRLAFQNKTSSGEGEVKAQKMALNFIIYVSQNEAGQKIPRVRFVTPLGLDIASGLGIRVDQGKEFQIPFQTCQNDGCVSDLQLGADVLRALTSGETAFVGYRLPNSKPIVLQSRLTGFSEAYSALVATNS